MRGRVSGLPLSGDWAASRSDPGGGCPQGLDGARQPFCSGLQERAGLCGAELPGALEIRL